MDFQLILRQNMQLPVTRDVFFLMCFLYLIVSMHIISA